MERHFNSRNEAIIRVVNLRGDDADGRVGIAHLPHEQACLLVEVQLDASLAPAGLLNHLHRMIVNADRGKARTPLELLLETRWKRQSTVHLGARQISSRKRKYAHQLVVCSDPAVSAVVRTDAVSALQMNDRGELIGGIGVDVDGDLLRDAVKAFVASLGDKALELGELRRSANRLEVFVQNLVGGNFGGLCRPAFCNFNLVRIIRRDAVLV